MFRSKRTPAPGMFLAMDAAKQAARASGLPITDLSIGASDLSPPPEALAALREAVDDPATYPYCLKSGTMPLLTAACDWYQRRYGVQLDPATNALCLIGSQVPTTTPTVPLHHCWPCAEWRRLMSAIDA